MPRETALTVVDVVRSTDVDGTVRNTRCAPVALNTPFKVTLASARRRSRSMADLSTPVVSCTARGVLISQFVTSLRISVGVPALVSTLSVVCARPVALAMMDSYPRLWMSARRCWFSANSSTQNRALVC